MLISDNFDNIREGDCIVCFSKNDIYHASRQLEKRGVEVAVIYGGLPPGMGLALFTLLHIWIFVNCFF